MTKGDRVSFVTRGKTVVATVVRVKRDGFVTVDDGDKWWDVRPQHLSAADDR